MKLVITIPALNEEATIGEVIALLHVGSDGRLRAF